MALQNTNTKALVFEINDKKGFYRPQSFDFAKSLLFDSFSENERMLNALYLSGVNEIASIICKSLSERGLLSSFFFEYNLLGSILDENTMNKLTSFLYVREDPQAANHSFVSNIIKYNNAVIDYFQKRDNYTLFYHPEVFIDPSQPKVLSSIVESETGQFSINQDTEAQIEDLISPMPLKEMGTIDESKQWVGCVQFEGRDYDSILAKSGAINRKDNPGHESIHEFHLTLHHFVSKDVKTVYMAIPILGARSSNRLSVKGLRNIQGQGVIFLLFSVPTSYTGELDSDLEAISESLFTELGDIVRLLTYNYLFNVGIHLQERARKESLKSAKSAIMSRNMSHNLGSHVMAYVKQHLNSVNGMIRDNVLSSIFQNQEEFELFFKYMSEHHARFQEFKKSDELALPFFVGLGQFISYLQERQDFIATIATDYIPYYSTVNFKDFVYDELNPDKRYERHKDRKDMRPDNILLGNIARSEGLGRKITPSIGGQEHISDIVLKFREFNGDSPKDNTEAEKSLRSMRGYNVSLPGGVVGRQAIFSIVENVIRNAAKHGNWRDVGKLALTFDIYTTNNQEDLERMSSNDNFDASSLSLREVVNKFYRPADDADDLYIVTLTDNLAFDNVGLIKLRQALAEDFVDDFGEMKNSNKGIKEMRISAAWLRSISDEADCTFRYPRTNKEQAWLDEKGWGVRKNKSAPVLYARISVERNSGICIPHLQYIFCLPIPRKVAIVSDSFSMLTEENRRLLVKQNWRAYTTDEFKRVKNKSFEFILLDDISGQYTKLRPITSSRLLSISEVPGISGIVKQVASGIINTEDVLRNLYKFTSDYSEGEKISILDKTTYGNCYKDKTAIQRVIPELGSYYQKGNVLISDGVKVEPYVYRTHHESLSEFVSYMNNSAFIGNLYVEGISGSNSTDRLVRNESLDEEWFYKHLHAMKSKVAVFDERIFSKIYGKEESDFSSIPSISEYNLESMREEYAQLYPEMELDILYMTSEELMDFILEKLRGHYDKEEVITDSHLGLAYEQKGISVYTLMRSKDDNSAFNLVGLLRGQTDTDQSFKCVCGTVAELRWIDNRLTVSFRNMNIAKCYDHFSIHQGLLDKLYEAFGIRNNPFLKEQLTLDFYRVFAKNNGTDAILIDETDNSWFLPKMCIHSGRSKPGYVDMPQKLPFIQYAAIEHAVMDCKYSLVELLDFARYEP